MLGWFSSRRTAAPAAVTASAVAAPAEHAAVPPSPATQSTAIQDGGAPGVPPSTLSWLLDGPQPVQAPPSDAERQWLSQLDRLLASPRLPADLLPRAASVIPQLLALMRQESPSRATMAQQVTKDLLLTAEVLRMARSPFYGAQPVETIDAALDRIGTAGLHSAMSKVLLKPVFQPHGGGLAARAAPRLWQRSEQKSMSCAAHMAREGGDRFEGFLAGLLHDSGWLALLRLIDRNGQAPSLPLSRVLDLSLERRKDRLFGRLVTDWDLSPALSALAQQLQSTPMPRLALPLAAALMAADQQCGTDAGAVQSPQPT